MCKSLFLDQGRKAPRLQKDFKAIFAVTRALAQSNRDEGPNRRARIAHFSRPNLRKASRESVQGTDLYKRAPAGTKARSGKPSGWEQDLMEQMARLVLRQQDTLTIMQSATAHRLPM